MTKLMIVDDEKIVRTSLHYLLGAVGIETELHSDGDEAILAYRSNPGGYAAVVTDLAMPRMPGSDLARAIWREDPTQPVVILTGLMTEDELDEFIEIEPCRILSKPAELVEILSALRSLGVPVPAQVIAA